MPVAKLLAIPTDYHDLHTYVNDRPNRDGERKIAHNTFARYFTDYAQGKAKIATIRYHYTDIVKFYLDSPRRIEFTLNGWDTITTRGRIQPVIQAFWKRHTVSSFYAGVGRDKGRTFLKLETLLHTYQWEIDPYGFYRIEVSEAMPLVTTDTREGWLQVVPTKVKPNGN